MAKETFPSFLGGIELSQGDVKRCSEILSNWLKVHAYISELKDSDASLDVLRKLMIIEYLRTPAPRVDILERLHGKYDRMRYRVERAQLTA